MSEIDVSEGESGEREGKYLQAGSSGFRVEVNARRSTIQLNRTGISATQNRYNGTVHCSDLRQEANRAQTSFFGLAIRHVFVIAVVFTLCYWSPQRDDDSLV
jgi:hypothetical protein